MEDAILTELKQIGARIRAARLDQKLSQQELAEASGISLPHISEIELGGFHSSLGCSRGQEYLQEGVFRAL